MSQEGQQVKVTIYIRKTNKKAIKIILTKVNNLTAHQLYHTLLLDHSFVKFLKQDYQNMIQTQHQQKSSYQSNNYEQIEQKETQIRQFTLVYLGNELDHEDNKDIIFVKNMSIFHLLPKEKQQKPQNTYNNHNLNNNKQESSKQSLKQSYKNNAHNKMVHNLENNINRNESNIISNDTNIISNESHMKQHTIEQQPKFSLNKKSLINISLITLKLFMIDRNKNKNLLFISKNIIEILNSAVENKKQNQIIQFIKKNQHFINSTKLKIALIQFGKVVQLTVSQNDQKYNQQIQIQDKLRKLKLMNNSQISAIVQPFFIQQNTKNNNNHVQMLNQQNKNMQTKLLKTNQQNNHNPKLTHNLNNNHQSLYLQLQNTLTLRLYSQYKQINVFNFQSEKQQKNKKQTHQNKIINNSQSQRYYSNKARQIQQPSKSSLNDNFNQQNVQPNKGNKKLCYSFDPFYKKQIKLLEQLNKFNNNNNNNKYSEYKKTEGKEQVETIHQKQINLLKNQQIKPLRIQESHSPSKQKPHSPIRQKQLLKFYQIIVEN